jgi:hypothetical protein
MIVPKGDLCKNGRKQPHPILPQGGREKEKILAEIMFIILSHYASLFDFKNCSFGLFAFKSVAKV